MQSFLVFTGLFLLPLVLGTSTKTTNLCCIPHKQPYWIFPRRTDTDAVVLSNAIVYNLHAFTLCMFIRDDPDESSSDENVAFSYATTESDDTLTFITSPKITMIVAGLVHIVTKLTISDGNWHQICFTWENSEGHYKLYIDGKLEEEGDSQAVGSVIHSGGTAVLGQDQDTVGGGFNLQQAFVGQLAEVNLWGTVLSASDIAAERSNCHITDGSVIRSLDFINLGEVRGGAQVVCG